MTHAVIIRCHYKTDDPKFEWRFNYFKDAVLPRLLWQKNKNFDICVWCNKEHAERFLKLSPRIKTFGIKPEAEGKIKPGYEQKAKRFHVDFVEWENVCGLEKYDIQTAIDSDDLIIRDDFIDFIARTCANEKESTHISFQPYMFNLPDKQYYTCPLRYGPKKGSPFYSIYQPNKEKFVFAYHDSHLKMWQYVKKTISIKEGYCAFSIHRHNATTYLYAGAKKINI